MEVYNSIVKPKAELPRMAAVFDALVERGFDNERMVFRTHHISNEVESDVYHPTLTQAYDEINVNLENDDSVSLWAYELVRSSDIGGRKQFAARLLNGQEYFERSVMVFAIDTNRKDSGEKDE